MVSWAQQKQDTTDALDRLLRKLETYQKNYPQERVYLHTDRSYYQSGEDIWFKAYITVSQFNFLSAISKIIYVELLNEQQEVVQSRRLPVISGLSMGDFKLPGTLAGGTYHIRAYTNWMRNFDETLFFHKTINITDSLSQGVFAVANFQSLKTDQDTILGTLHFHDIHGKPIASRQVDYTIRLDAKNSVHGKGMIDEGGTLSLKFPKNGHRKNTGSSKLHLTIENGNRPPIVKTIAIQMGSKRPTVQFYPEGGSLISGITSKVGFQSALADTPYPVKGYLESDGQELLNFASDSSGIGNFSLIPQAGKVYTAVIPLHKGDTLRAQLPQIQTAGFSLAVNNFTDERVQAKVTTQASAVKQQTLTLIAQNNGMVFYAAKHQLTHPEFAFSIPKDKLPSGVIRLTVLDEGMHFLAERALFIAHPSDSLNLSLQTNKQLYHPREKVDVQFSTKNQRDSTIGTFSAAVVNISKIPSGQDNIFSTLWFNNNTYQSPALPFTDVPLTPEQIDNRMLCLPLHRHFWQDIRAGKFPENAYKPEKELKISGTITNAEGKPLPQAKVTLVSLQNATAVLDTLTNAEGRFSFDKILFYNQPEFIVQARDAKGRKNVNIKLDESPNQELAEAKNASEIKIKPNASQDSTTRSNRQSLDELQEGGFDGNSILLEEVKVNEKKESPAKYSSNLNGAGHADQVISGDELFMSSCPSLDMCLQGRLTGVIFRGGVPYSTRSPNRPMQVVLDGMYVDAFTLNTINPFDVASIEVLRTVGNTSIYGMYGANGVLIITTRRGDQPRATDHDLYSPGITTFSPQGFYAIRNFQAPDYSKIADGSISDTRTTIDWQPDIIADKNVPGRFSFYTADEPGIYRITVEGLDINGRLAHREITFRVE
ncbi:hypothetical protein GCM10023231_33650 [Olivibacter ginsenosidimutans]|uniref:TonB-dependent receptor plug domain-containing protein n=1 Tax=Olivibacter ginsenosidimutans TaxID=1176537 RepID=A0ABP9BYS0_9SPHI